METHDGTGTIIIVDFLINNGIFVSQSSLPAGTGQTDEYSRRAEGVYVMLHKACMAPHWLVTEQELAEQ